MNVLPELTKAHCTVLGAWGEATADNHILHLRALDWEAFLPINQYPSVVIYEPTEEGSQSFANIGYLGFIGALTAMSKTGLTVGEKVWIMNEPQYYDVKPVTTYIGKPWMFVLRDTIQFSTNLADIESSLKQVSRTAMIHGGWGSLPDNSFRGMDYAANLLDLFDDKDYILYNNVSHPQMDGMFFLDKHTQPSDDPCTPNIIQS